MNELATAIEKKESPDKLKAIADKLKAVEEKLKGLKLSEEDSKKMLEKHGKDLA